MEREFLESLVLAHQAELFRYLLYLGAEDSTAEDLVQDTFLAAYHSSTPCDGMDMGARAAWLRGIGRHLFLTHCRRHRREVPLDPERAEVVWKTQFLRASDGFDYTEALDKCVESLPENQRKLLDLRYRDNASRAEIARAFRMTEEGAKSFLRRTRGALVECIEKRLKMEGAQ